MRRSILALVLCVVALAATAVVAVLAQKAETPSFPAVSLAETADFSTLEGVESYIDRTRALMEEVRAAQPSKIDQWQARDDLIELVFDVDEETAHYLYNVVQAALEQIDEQKKATAAIRSQIEANKARALVH